MSKVHLLDAKSAELKGTRKLTDTGYLVSDAFVARTGVQLYRGSEIGMPDKDIVRVYRPESAVRDVNSLRSFSHAPVTIGHPAEDVTAANWKDLAVGEVSTEVTWQDNKIKIPLILKDAKAISLVEGGTRELSPGYSADIVIQAGVTDSGEEYDAIQQNIRVNHLAIVPRGRSGHEVRIGDSADMGHGGHTWGAAPIHDAKKEATMATRTIFVDGLSVETTDAGAQAIEKLQRQLKDAETKAKEELDEKDRELAKEKAAKEKAEKEKLTDAQIDELVAARADVISKARAIIGDAESAGLSNEDIRRMVVAKKLGDAAVTGKSDAFVEVRFDDLATAAANRKPDPVLSGLKKTPVMDSASDGGWDHALAAVGVKSN